MHGPRAPPRPPAAAAARLLTRAQDRNLILAATSEFRPGAVGGGGGGRYIGLVVVPGAVIVRIEADDAPARRGWGFAAGTTQVVTSVA